MLNSLLTRINCVFYNISLAHIFYKIYNIYDTNINEYIDKLKEFDKLIQLYENFMNKHNINSYNLYYNSNNNKYYNFIPYAHLTDNKMTYDVYLEFYNLINNYLDSLTKINKLLIRNTDGNKKTILDKNKKTTTEEKNKQNSETTKKYKKKSIPVALKRNVWNK